MSADEGSTRFELRAGVRTAVDGYLRAVASRDSTAIRGVFAPDGRVTWIEDGQLRYSSTEGILAGLAGFPPGMPIVTELDTLMVMPVGGHAAHAWAPFHTRVGEGDSSFSFAGALSLVLEQQGGSWRIVAGHTSSPRPR